MVTGIEFEAEILDVGEGRITLDRGAPAYVILPATKELEVWAGPKLYDRVKVTVVVETLPEASPR